MNKLSKSIKYAKKALKLAKECKSHDDESKDYILLFGVDIWSRMYGPIYDHNTKYLILDRFGFSNSNLFIYRCGLGSVLTDKSCHFTRPFLEKQRDCYSDFLMQHDLDKHICVPKIMTVDEFGIKFGGIQ